MTAAPSSHGRVARLCQQLAPQHVCGDPTPPPTRHHGAQPSGATAAGLPDAEAQQRAASEYHDRGYVVVRQLLPLATVSALRRALATYIENEVPTQTDDDGLRLYEGADRDPSRALKYISFRGERAPPASSPPVPADRRSAQRSTTCRTNPRTSRCARCRCCLGSRRWPGPACACRSNPSPSRPSGWTNPLFIAPTAPRRRHTRTSGTSRHSTRPLARRRACRRRCAPSGSRSTRWTRATAASATTPTPTGSACCRTRGAGRAASPSGSATAPPLRHWVRTRRWRSSRATPCCTTASLCTARKLITQSAGIAARLAWSTVRSPRSQAEG